MSEIFISHSSKDEIFARLLACDLEKLGVKIWRYDEIPIGADWHNKMTQALEKSNCLLLIISPASMASQYVEEEWRYFVENGKAIIPLLWEECEDLPTELTALNHIDCLNRDYDLILSKLVAVLTDSGQISRFTKFHTPTILAPSDVPQIDTLIDDARNIYIIGISTAASIGMTYFPLLSERLKSSACNISIILLDPESELGVDGFTAFMNGYSIVIDDIKGMLSRYKSLIQQGRQEPGFGKCEVRLLDFYVPYAMVGVNMKDQDGIIRISYFGYSRTGSRCPRVLFTRAQESIWYDIYVEQFTKLWDKAAPYNP